MTKKLIAIDLDGTTLNSQSLISKRTSDVLMKATKQGHIVSIATGRPYRMSHQFYKQLQLTSPMVNFNGSLVHVPEKKWTYESERFIHRDIAFSILEKKEELHLDFVAAENRENFYIDAIESIDPEFFVAGQLSNENLFVNLKTNPTSLLLKTQHQFSSLISEKLMQEFPNDIDVRTWGGPNAILEIVPKGVHKATGVDIIVNSLNLTPKDVIAFGDEHNDVELLEYAGWGVAMKNATDQLKGVANDITKASNNEDGLADYLENYLSL